MLAELASDLLFVGAILTVSALTLTVPVWYFLVGSHVKVLLAMRPVVRHRALQAQSPRHVGAATQPPNASRVGRPVVTAMNPRYHMMATADREVVFWVPDDPSGGFSPDKEQP
ncbi:hypothetical protein KEM52_002392 [Ascosphaera acerosa]|nr:hypothetical protein KEM52_002392 [Ascosphaera acerosa]